MWHPEHQRSECGCLQAADCGQDRRSAEPDRLYRACMFGTDSHDSASRHAGSSNRNCWSQSSQVDTKRQTANALRREAGQVDDGIRYDTDCQLRASYHDITTWNVGAGWKSTHNIRICLVLYMSMRTRKDMDLQQLDLTYLDMAQALDVRRLRCMWGFTSEREEYLGLRSPTPHLRVEVLKAKAFCCASALFVDTSVCAMNCSWPSTQRLEGPPRCTLAQREAFVCSPSLNAASLTSGLGLVLGSGFRQNSLAQLARRF